MRADKPTHIKQMDMDKLPLPTPKKKKQTTCPNLHAMHKKQIK